MQGSMERFFAIAFDFPRETFVWLITTAANR